MHQKHLFARYCLYAYAKCDGEGFFSMRNRSLLDLGLIFTIYLLIGAGIYFFVQVATAQSIVEFFSGSITNDWPEQTSVNEFRNALSYQIEVVMQISMVSALAWYVIGEWGPVAYKTSQGILIWLSLIIPIAVACCIATFLGASASQSTSVPIVIYFISGGGLYYVVTMTLWPINMKYVVPGSKLMRRRW